MSGPNGPIAARVRLVHLSRRLGRPQQTTCWPLRHKEVVMGATACVPRRRRLTATVVVVLSVLATVLLSPARHAGADQPGPTHDRLKQAQRQAAATQRELDKAKLAVSGAHNVLVSRAATAKMAIDRYAHTMQKVTRARMRAAVAQAREAAAAARVARQQRLVQDYARAAYMSGGPMSALAVVLSASGPTGVLDRAGLLNQVSQSQAEMLLALGAAQQEQASAAAEAQTAQLAVERVAARADRQRRSALVAMANQQALLQNLSDAQAGVTARLARQETHVKHLAQKRAAIRLARVAAERAQLAAAWAAMANVGDSMPWASVKQGHMVVKAARRQLGVPYSWGGGDFKGATLGAVNEFGNRAGLRTVGFDCSGLALYAWAKAGFSLDHYTGYQWVEGHRVSLDHLRAGDLVFFAKDVSDPLSIHHVGIYVNHNRMIDAPHTGAVVRYDKVFVPGLIGGVRP